MIIWVDGDACPKAIKDVLYRAAIRTRITLIIVANQLITIPLSPYIKRYQVGSGLDVTDKYITAHLNPGDLVITADIPFADAVISQKGYALNPRGELYTTDNIKQYLGLRNFHESLRGAQMMSGGPEKLTPKDTRIFANQLDRFLASH